MRRFHPRLFGWRAFVNLFCITCWLWWAVAHSEVDFDEFFEWWCTRTVADRERLRGVEAQTGPVADRISKLKVPTADTCRSHHTKQQSTGTAETHWCARTATMTCDNNLLRRPAAGPVEDRGAAGGGGHDSHGRHCQESQQDRGGAEEGASK